MVPILILVALVLLMVIVLLFPDGFNDLMRSGIPYRIRPRQSQPNHFPVIMIFLLGIGLSYQLGLGRTTLPPNGLVRGLGCVAGIVLAVIGLYACYRPLRFMSAFIGQLRGVPENALNHRAIQIVERSSKLLGAIFLLACGLLVHFLVA
jgi:hypothetical protein